jgi:hypothetical protein
MGARPRPQATLSRFVIRLGDVSKRVSGKSWVFIPRGSVHGWRNSGSTDGRLFFIFTPGVGAKPFEEMSLRGMPIPDLDPAIRDAIFERHGFEFITADWS